MSGGKIFVPGKRLFVDMDGVLARFHDNILDDEGHVQIEKMHEPDFFRKLDPFNNMIEAIRSFVNKHKDIEVYILSAAEPGDPPGFIRQKNEWLDDLLPEIDSKHRLFPGLGERKSSYIPGGISIIDHLLDDYNKNLKEWIKDGGKAIKVKNNINHRGTGKYGGDVGNLWRGDMVSNMDSPDKILKDIEYFMGLGRDFANKEMVKELPKEGMFEVLPSPVSLDGKAPLDKQIFNAEEKVSLENEAAGKGEEKDR